MSARAVVLAAAFSALAATPAGSFCMYDGEMYAKTTVRQEFADSPVVVRAKVLAARDLSPWGDDGERGTLYTLAVEQSFKGNPPATITYFSERNSGGFYVDTGATYLLFLTTYDRPVWRRFIGDAYAVNYPCGQSLPWSDIPGADRRWLEGHSR
ncbi:MAG: hypothetical protein ACOY4K_15015 [Pseudomonadota bacterium]